MVNDIFKTPLTTHIYRSYTVLPPAVGGSSVDVSILKNDENSFPLECSIRV